MIDQLFHRRIIDGKKYIGEQQGCMSFDSGPQEVLFYVQRSQAHLNNRQRVNGKNFDHQARFPGASSACIFGITVIRIGWLVLLLASV